MAQKPIIHMHEAGQKIPFDVSLYRSIKFSRIRPRDIKSAKEDLTKMVDRALSPDYQVENPITNARGRAEFEKHATPEQQVLLDQLRAIEERLAAIEERDDQFSMRPIEPVLAPRSPQFPHLLDKNYVSPFKVGETVKHPRFGTGKITAVENAKLTIAFPRGPKRVVDSFVTHN
jgi:hypothetical protein